MAEGNRFIIDRLEGALAVLEGLGSVPRALLPQGVSEGDVLMVESTEGVVTIRMDGIRTTEAEAEVRALRSELTPLPVADDGSFDL